MSKKSGKMLVLTLDIGSSGVRARLFDQDGNQHKPKAKRPYTLTTTPDGGAVLDAQEIATACEDMLDEVCAGLHHAIIAVACDTLVPNILGLNDDGEPITPAYTWGDTRAAAAAAELRTRLDPDAYHQRTGCFIHPSYVPAKLLWLRQTQPELYGRVKRWVSLGEYLMLRWFGEARCSSSAASWSGLLDRTTQQWDTPTLAAIELDQQQLGTVVDVGDASRGLRSRYRNRWPALGDAPFLPAVGDGVGSNIGSDCTTPDRVALAIGTSGAVRVLLHDEPDHIPDGLWSYRVDKRRSLLGGALSNGSNVITWLTQTLALPSSKHLAAALADGKPDAGGLTILPLLAGERSPTWEDNATAAFNGMRLSTQPLDIYRATLEAVAYRYALILRALTPCLPSDYVIVASGRGAQASPAWTQIMADVFGKPVIVTDVGSATARGIALLAQDVLGIAPLLTRSLDHLTTFQPHPEHHGIYEQALERHTRLFETLY